MKTFLEFNSLLISVCGSSIFGILVVIYKFAKLKINEQSAKLVLIEKSLLAISHDKIYMKCNEFLAQGYITTDDLDNLEYLYKGYKGLGGNGTGDVIYKRVQELKIISGGNNHEVK